MVENLTCDIVYSSEAGGIRLNVDQVRSSVARKLGIKNVKQTALSHYVDSVVSVMLGAVQYYDMILAEERLYAWQAALFPSGYSEGSQMEIGRYRTNEEHIVSGTFERKKIYYTTPSPDRIEEEMQKFLGWFNKEEPVSSVICSTTAHLQFVSVHPFENGNGRLACILSNTLLARGEKSRFRFYNISPQINRNKKHYYGILKRMQRRDGDVTEWLVWYMQKLVGALDEAGATVTTILGKSFFWQEASVVPMTERQTQMFSLFLDGYEAKITSRTWATLAKCSRDIAIRGIQDLVDKNILVGSISSTKQPSYSIVYDKEDLTQFFMDVNITEENGVSYPHVLSKAKKPICEGVTKLDADRYLKDGLLLNNSLNKYCLYMIADNRG